MRGPSGISAALAKVLRRRRKEKGLSQEELSEIANVDKTYISLIELGKQNPSVDIAERLARALGAKLSAFIEEAERVGKR